MAYQQVAKLYLRGSLCNVILKNLNNEQREELEEIIGIAMTDPSLQRCRREFCNALARTIRNEYEDTDVGEQDLRIAIMRAALAAKFGDNPTPETITDPIQRKKWFQTWIFNYLRQVLRENRLPRINKKKTISCAADIAAVATIREAITKVIANQKDIDYRRFLAENQKKMEIEENSKGFLMKFNHWAFPPEINEEIGIIKDKYAKYGISISYTACGIEIIRLYDSVQDVSIVQRTETMVRMTSFDDSNDEDNHRDNLEMEAKHMGPTNTIEQAEEHDIITILRSNIPIDAHPVLDIMIDDTRPYNYTERYGDNAPKISHISEYLNISIKEVKRLKGIIRVHCLALGVGR